VHFASENWACRAPFHIHIATLCMPLFCDVHVCVSGLFRSLHKLISPLDFLQVAPFVLEAFFHKHGPSPISGFPRKWGLRWLGVCIIDKIYVLIMCWILVDKFTTFGASTLAPTMASRLRGHLHISTSARKSCIWIHWLGCPVTLSKLYSGCLVVMISTMSLTYVMSWSYVPQEF
jgi:hypothetical protein